MSFSFSRRSLENLKDVHPDLIRVVTRGLILSKIDFVITEGKRTLERQKELKAAGKSQTLDSKHLSGHAIDVAAYVNGEVKWEWEYYEEISHAMKRASEELTIPLKWGGDWDTFKDGVHFELMREEKNENA